jgi:hypothetical protein
MIKEQHNFRAITFGVPNFGLSPYFYCKVKASKVFLTEQDLDEIALSSFLQLGKSSHPHVEVVNVKALYKFALSYSGGHVSYSGGHVSFSGGHVSYSGGHVSFSGGHVSYSGGHVFPLLEMMEYFLSRPYDGDDCFQESQPISDEYFVGRNFMNLMPLKKLRSELLILYQMYRQQQKNSL